jgi:hypothetical protein
VEHGLSVIYGLALGAGFVGLFGFAIDNQHWVWSVALLLIATALVGLASSLKGLYRYANLYSVSDS